MGCVVGTDVWRTHRRQFRSLLLPLAARGSHKSHAFVGRRTILICQARRNWKSNLRRFKSVCKGGGRGEGGATASIVGGCGRSRKTRAGPRGYLRDQLLEIRIRRRPLFLMKKKSCRPFSFFFSFFLVLVRLFHPSFLFFFTSRVRSVRSGVVKRAKRKHVAMIEVDGLRRILSSESKISKLEGRRCVN